MQFSWPIFLLVLGLGVVQLAVGVVFGRFLPIRGWKLARSRQSNAPRLRRYAGRLFELVNSVAEDVDQCQTQIKQVNQELASVKPGGGDYLPESVLESVARIIQINERLQSRLIAAEEKLEAQTKQIESQMAEARTDPLTGLPNRRAFDDELHRRVAEWQRKNTTISLMMVDIDHFKALNDRHGHPAGDHVLHNVAKVLETTLRDMDMVARVGGEEFAAILPNTGLANGSRAAERTRIAVASHWFQFEETDLKLTVSLGLATVDAGDDAASLMKRADEALYAAKRGGRNCGYFHNGRICKRIDRPGPPAAGLSRSKAQADESPNSDAPDADELAAISDDLRDRLAELADGGVES